MKFIKVGCLVCAFMIAMLSHIYCQKVTVSREIGIRNNYAYEILPNIEDRIIFYHDRGTEQQFEIYDNNLRHIQSLIPEFEKKNIIPAGLIGMDTSFNFYYSYRDEDSTILKVNVYDKSVSLKDTNIISVNRKNFKKDNPKFAYSQDKSKVLIFNPDDKNLHLQLIDNYKRKLIYGLK